MTRPRHIYSLALTAAVAVLLVAGPAVSQWQSISTNQITPADPTQPMTIGPVTAPLTISPLGELVRQPATDGYVFLAAPHWCAGDNQATQFVATRVAASDWARARTAAGAETHNIYCNLNSTLQRIGGTRGLKITSLRISHQITVAALTSATWGKVSARVFADGVANAVSAELATAPTLPTATQAAPYMTTVALAVPAYLPAVSNTSLDLEYTVVMANTGVYRLYGIGVFFTRLD